MTDPNNRYKTLFEDIEPIKYGSWCQKARALTSLYFNHYIRLTTETIDTLHDRHRIRLPQSQCQGKKKYKSWRAANESLITQKNRNARHGGHEDLSRIRIYHCEHCNTWHLGHKPST